MHPTSAPDHGAQGSIEWYLSLAESIHENPANASTKMKSAWNILLKSSSWAWVFGKVVLDLRPLRVPSSSPQDTYRVLLLPSQIFSLPVEILVVCSAAQTVCTFHPGPAVCKFIQER